MKETNDYAMYSGGFIFDALDRAALDYVRKESGLKNKVIVTQSAEIDFKRQLCCNEFTIKCSNYEEMALYSTVYFCTATMYDASGILTAIANFQFTQATNHCIIKGGEDNFLSIQS